MNAPICAATWFPQPLRPTLIKNHEPLRLRHCCVTPDRGCVCVWRGNVWRVENLKKWKGRGRTAENAFRKERLKVSGHATQVVISPRVMSPHAGAIRPRSWLGVWSLPSFSIPFASQLLSSRSALLSHTPLLTSPSPLLQLPGSTAAPSPVYGNVRLLAETKNAPWCVNKPSFKEIELYGDKRCPWAWVQITDWSDTADSLCFVN